MKPRYVLPIWIKNGKLFQQFRGWTYRNIPQIWKHRGNHQPIARPRCISVDTFASAGEKQHLHHSKVSIMAVPIKLLYAKATNWAFLSRSVTSPAKKKWHILSSSFSPIHRKHHLNPSKSDFTNILNSNPTKIGERVPSPQRFYRCRYFLKDMDAHDS